MRSFRIEHEVDLFAARRSAREIAAAIGFDRRASTELAIAVSELASNIVKYGVRGSITIEPIDDDTHGEGICIIASDEGPPFRDFETALQDGCDDKGPLNPVSFLVRHGIGAGLGAVKRFSDTITLEPTAKGKRIVVTRYLKRSVESRR